MLCYIIFISVFVIHTTNGALVYRTDDRRVKRGVVNIRGPNGIEGKLYLEENLLSTSIKGSITGVPKGEHGFHIHQYGDLSNGCKSTGGHYNPFKRVHAAPEDCERHVGDLGNMVADEEGVMSIDINDKMVVLNGPYSVIGRAIVIHAKADDLGKGGNKGSLATGNAGGRIACGTIGLI